MRNDAPNVDSQDSDDVPDAVPDFEPDASNEATTTFAPGDKVRPRKEHPPHFFSVDGREVLAVMSEIVGDATNHDMTVIETSHQSAFDRACGLAATVAQSAEFRRMLRLHPELRNLKDETLELVKVSIKTSYGSKEVEFYADSLEHAPD